MPLRPQIIANDAGIELIFKEGMRRLSVYNVLGKCVFRYQGNVIFRQNIILPKNNVYLVLVNEQKAFKYFLNAN